MYWFVFYCVYKNVNIYFVFFHSIYRINLASQDSFLQTYPNIMPTVMVVWLLYCGRVLTDFKPNYKCQSSWLRCRWHTIQISCFCSAINFCLSSIFTPWISKSIHSYWKDLERVYLSTYLLVKIWFEEYHQKKNFPLNLKCKWYGNSYALGKFDTLFSMMSKHGRLGEKIVCQVPMKFSYGAFL